MVLSADEVVRFLEAVPSLKTRTAVTTAYAAGLRASEAVGVKVGDVDSDRMVIRVEHGKGGEDRTVMLLVQLLGILRHFLTFDLTGGEKADSPHFETLVGLGPDINPRAARRQGLRQQGQSCGLPQPGYRSGHSLQIERQGQAEVLSNRTLQRPRPHRAIGRQAQALQAHRATL